MNPNKDCMSLADEMSECKKYKNKKIMIKLCPYCKKKIELTRGKCPKCKASYKLDNGFGKLVLSFVTICISLGFMIALGTITYSACLT